MSCTIQPFYQLTGSPDTGGSWAQLSGPSSLLGGVSQPWDVLVDPSSASPGTYVLEYTVGSGACSATSQVTITINSKAGIGIGSGTVLSITYCDTDATPYNLYSLLGASTSTDGVWTGAITNPGYSAGTVGDPTDNTFTPASAGAVGTYNFTYTVNHGDATTPTNCTDCVVSATISIKVVNSADAGGNGTITICNNIFV